MSISEQAGVWEARWRLMRHSPRLVRAHLRLLSVEINFASSSLRSMAISTGVVLVCGVALIGILAAGAVVGLTGMGMSPISAVAITGALPLVIGLISAWTAFNRFNRMTLPQSRKRLRTLLELIDD